MSSGNTGVMQIGEWLVDPALDVIVRGGETRKLEPRTMRLLLCLANTPGGVVSVETLLTEVWSGVVVGSASVYQAVSQLRKLLDDTDPEPTYIATVPRRGYRLVAPVRRLEKPAASSVSIGVAVDTPTAAVRRRPLRLALAALAAAVVLAGTVLWVTWPLTGRQSASMASIVVLPFVDMTADKSDQFFCDGLTEELSNWLAQIPTLKVVARTSAFAFRGQSEDVRKIGTALDTNHVLEGSIRSSGDHMRITVQLIDARNGYHLWSADYDRPREDVIKIQEDISRSVAQNLQIRLTAESDREFAARRTTDGQAYDLYLLARHYTQQETPEGVDRANELYRQVLRLDSNFVPAYVGLAWGILNRGYFRDLPTADTAAQMEPLIAAALRIDARFSGAYAVRGALRSAQSRTAEALADLQYAIALNASDLGAVAEIGRIRLVNGQPRQALQSYDRAAALDPLNHTLQIQRCVALQDLARYTEAAAACERARVLQPADALVADAQVWLAESRGRVDEALKWNAESIKDEPGDEFDYYWIRSRLYLSLGLARPARQAVELGRSATKNDDEADAALVRVVYCEGGKDALRRYMDSRRLDQSTHALPLFEAAYSRLLLGDPVAVKNLLARALAAPDREPGLAEAPWFARGTQLNPSYRIELAAAEIALGDRASADKELATVMTMIDGMIAAGVERHAVYELRAKTHALQGRGDEAMADLVKAADLGWRRSWWAAREPYFASLRSRKDFQSLLARVDHSNEQFIARLAGG
jgi:TolB-like protein/DNA-binding winged helix-turn-helix (wHTH) protein